MKRCYISAICRLERHNGILCIRESIDKYGFLLDFHRFSDITISMNIEIESQKMNEFLNDLATFLDIDMPVTCSSCDSGSLFVLMQVTFSEGRGDLRIEVPRVPG